MLRGAAFQLKGTPDDRFHIWVIVGEKNGKALAINITDECWSPDSTCKFSAGEHPSITKSSVVFYKKARIFSSAAVAAELASGTSVRRFQDFPDAILNKIKAGAICANDFTASYLAYFPP